MQGKNKTINVLPIALDTCCTKHVSNTQFLYAEGKLILHKTKESKKTMVGFTGKPATVEGVGTSTIKTSNGKIISLKDTQYVPSASRCLFSVLQAVKQGFGFSFTPTEVVCYHIKTNEVIFKGRYDNEGLPVVDSYPLNL
jgi:hypothetical protein